MLTRICVSDEGLVAAQPLEGDCSWGIEPDLDWQGIMGTAVAIMFGLQQHGIPVFQIFIHDHEVRL